jgi:hypothetical protein
MVRIAFPNLLWMTLAVVVIGAIITLIRRPRLPRLSLVLFLLGALALALACGGITLNLPSTRDIAVMVDMSPSTRTAIYRDRNELQHRLDQLLGGAPHREIQFFDENADQTTYKPPADAEAVLLFSDGQFAVPPSAPPTFIVVDPALEHPEDAAIVQLESLGDDAIAVHTRSAGPTTRQVAVSGSASPTTLPAGATVQTVHVDSSSAEVISAKISPGDAWPENDAMSIRMPAPAEAQRWWIGAAPSDASGWRVMAPADLPADAAGYLAPGVIVLNNIPADAISSMQQIRLAQYVRDLGGGLVILGGNRAFGVGDYVGSQLEALSPLASFPDSPQREWIILVDSSGSMASQIPTGGTRWQRASAAAVNLLSHLPPNDPVNIGSFARDMRFWSPLAKASEMARKPLPPSDVVPQGPTNLEPILKELASRLDPGSRIEIILISDGDATIQNPEAIAESFRKNSARIHLLATGNSSRASVQRLTVLTAGSFAPQADPALWNSSLRQLLAGTLVDRLGAFPLKVEFTGDLAALPARAAPVWNKTWVKPQATLLATGDDAGSRAPAVAQWKLGAGQVAAAAFATNPEETAAITALMARPPRDPRFKISFTPGPKLVVSVIAAENDRQMNGLNLSLSLRDETDPTSSAALTKIPQTAPGKYELSIPAPRSAGIATIRLNDQILDRFAAAGRYAPEFDAIGNDHDAMRKLAEQSGGAVIEPSQTSPIDVIAAKKPVNLTTVLALIGSLCIAGGLIGWKRIA